MLDGLTLRLRNECLRVLCRICGRQALLPRSLLQTPRCYDLSDGPFYRGGFADVWMGEYEGRKVAVKVPRTYSAKDFGRIARVGNQQNFAESTQ